MATAQDCIETAVSRHPNATGIVLLIGNDYRGNTKGHAELLGPLKDMDRAHQVFTSLGAVCVSITNKTAREIRATVKSLAECTYPEGYQYIVIVYSGHGDRSGVLIANDGEKLSLDHDIVNPFQPKNAKAIAKLPKLFFIDACRGEQQTGIIQVPRGSSTDNYVQCPRGGEGLEQMRFPEIGNTFMAFSTLEDKLSYERQQHGSTWMRLMLDTFAKHADKDVCVIFHDVNEKLMEHYQGLPQHTRIQQPESRSTLHRSFNFKECSLPRPELQSQSSVDHYTVKLNEMKKEKKIVKDRDYHDLLPRDGNHHVRLEVTFTNGERRVFESNKYSSTYDSINKARERVACEAVKAAEDLITQSASSSKPSTKKPLLSSLFSGSKASKQIPKSAAAIERLPEESEAMQELKNVLVDKAGYTLTEENYKITESKSTTDPSPQFQCTFVHPNFPRIQGDRRQTKKKAKNAMALKVLKYYMKNNNNDKSHKT